MSKVSFKYGTASQLANAPYLEGTFYVISNNESTDGILYADLNNKRICFGDVASLVEDVSDLESSIPKRVSELMNIPMENLKTVVCHLGQGASLCAVKNGKSVDTSMGLTPISGIMMCARVGDIDPSVITYIMKKDNLKADEVENILNKHSGVYGISGVSPDFRDIEKAVAENNKRAKLSIDAYCYNVAGYIAKYAVSMKGIDVIAFTAGVGENQISIRKNICEYLE